MVTIEDELSAIGENQKQLEVSEEKARRREEKYQVAVSKKGRKKQLNIKSHIDFFNLINSIGINIISISISPANFRTRSSS